MPGSRRRLAGVVVEADPRLAPEPAGAEHLAQRRRAREAPLAELVEQHVADRPERVQADEVGERAAAPSGARRRPSSPRRSRPPSRRPLRGRGSRRACTGTSRRLTMKPGLVLAWGSRACPPSARTRAPSSNASSRGGHAAHDLDELHHLRGVEVVQPDELAGRDRWRPPGRSPPARRCSSRTPPRGLTISSTSRHISSFSGRLSVIASITRSQSASSR